MSGLLKRLIGKKKRNGCSAVIVAAGSSDRMGGINKIFHGISGVPVLARTLMAFQDCPDIDEIIVVVRLDDADEAAELCSAYPKVSKVVFGGETRTQSVYNGVTQCAPGAEFIAIHDGARPLVPLGVITDTVRLAQKHSAAAPGVKMTSTVKRVKNGVVTDTPDRGELYEIQTPQVFDADLIKGALSAGKTEFTDDCAAVEALGVTVWISEGSYRNIKITTKTDLAIAEALIRSEDAGAAK